MYTLSSTGCRTKPRLTSVTWHHYYTSLIIYMDHVLPLICDRILLLSTDLLVHHHLNSSKSCWDSLTSAIKLIITLKITVRSLSDPVILYFYHSSGWGCQYFFTIAFNFVYTRYVWPNKLTAIFVDSADVSKTTTFVILCALIFSLAPYTVARTKIHLVSQFHVI